MGITLKQLAELSGLSVRTVSRVLKGQAHVNPDKRAQIMRLAQENHYVPNMAARNLRLNHAKFVGILCSNLSYEINLHKLVDLEQRLEARGYYPIVGSCDAHPAAVEKMFAECAGMVEFVVILLWDAAAQNARLPELFHRYNLTPIYVDQVAEPEHGHQLKIDRNPGIGEAVSTLMQHGKKRLLHCGGIPSRTAGLQYALAHIPVKQRPELLHLPGDITFDAGREIAPKIMATKCDAVLFDTDRQALGFLNYASEHHLAIPDEIAVIGFDDDVGSKLVYPALSTVAHPVAELNQAIVNIIENKPQEMVRQSFATKFILRQSC